MTVAAAKIPRHQVATYWVRAIAAVLVSSMACAMTLGVGASAAPKTRVWSRTQSIEVRNRSAMSVVSCPSTTFCAAVDNSGDVHYWKKGSWSAPQHLNAGGSLSSISCPTTTFCVAIGSEAIAYNGRTWHVLGSLDSHDIYQISCPTTMFCAATGANGIAGKPSSLAIFDGSTWSSQNTVSTGKLNDRVLGVSCASATYCVAVNWNGKILAYDGSRWKTLTKVGPAGLISVSCVSESFCLALSDEGRSVVIHGDSWTDQRDIPSLATAFAYSVSCSTAQKCVAIGLNGRSATWLDGKWSQAHTVFRVKFVSGVSVSCVAAQCMAINAEDRSSLYRW